MTICLAALILLPACGLEVEPVSQTAWEASLTPRVPDTEIRGTAAAVSNSAGTEVSVKLFGLEPNTPYDWYIRGNDCGDPGPIFGSSSSYPELVTGDAVERVVLVAAFFENRLTDGASYHIAVLADDDQSTALSCGSLIQR